MTTSPFLTTAKIEKLIYLFIAASPGGFRIFTLAVVGILSGGKTQGEVANDLAIIAFLSMLTAIGAGTQILHLIPKSSNEETQAGEIFKGLLAKLTPYIFTICGIIYIADKFLIRFLANSIEASLLLFTSSIYWLFRHYFLARPGAKNLILMESTSWIASAAGFTILFYTESLVSSNALLSISAAYCLSFLPALASLIKYRANHKPKILHDATSIGLSNLASGGVINLASSICYHVGGASLSGAIGLMTNISSITLTVIRALLLKKIPQISDSIFNSDQGKFKELHKNTQNKINSITVACFFAIQPLSILTTYQSQTELGILSLTIYSALITSFICTPQFSAVDSIIINYFGRSKSMLALNLTHALLVTASTFIAFMHFGKSPVVFFVFLISSILLYFLRNKIIQKITYFEIKKSNLQ